MYAIRSYYELLNDANIMNPGKWYNHSIYAAAAAKNIAAKLSDLDEERAEILGLLHDIGRRYGITHIKHTIDGYSFCKGLGYDFISKIVITSYSIHYTKLYDRCLSFCCLQVCLCCGSRSNRNCNTA